MLGKLMKYEMQATQRIFLPLFGLIILFSLINKAFITFNLDKMEGLAVIPFAISMFIYCILIAALFVVTLVVTIQRFYKNLLGDEGYLSFTLPVKAHSHIDSKMLITLMWIILSMIVSALSIFLLAIDRNNMNDFSRFCMAVGSFFNQYGAQAYGILVEGILLILTGSLCEILQIYASVTVGNLSSKHKLLAGFGAYIGFGVIQQIVASIIMFELVSQKYFEGLNHVDNLPVFLQVFASGCGIFILYACVFAAAFYFFTNWMLSKKLNME